jgi:hypothetical protein
MLCSGCMLPCSALGPGRLRPPHAHTERLRPLPPARRWRVGPPQPRPVAPPTCRRPRPHRRLPHRSRSRFAKDQAVPRAMRAARANISEMARGGGDGVGAAPPW